MLMRATIQVQNQVIGSNKPKNSKINMNIIDNLEVTDRLVVNRNLVIVPTTHLICKARTCLPCLRIIPDSFQNEATNTTLEEELAHHPRCLASFRNFPCYKETS